MFLEGFEPAILWHFIGFHFMDCLLSQLSILETWRLMEGIY